MLVFLWKFCIDSLSCLLILMNLGGGSIVSTLFNKWNKVDGSHNLFINTPDVVPCVDSVSLHRILSIRVPLLFVSLVRTVIFGIKAVAN